MTSRRFNGSASRRANGRGRRHAGRQVKNILVTMGDPAGISGEIIIKAHAALLAGRLPVAKEIRRRLRTSKGRANLYVAGDLGVLARAARELGRRISLSVMEGFAPAAVDLGPLRVFPLSQIDLRRFRYGVPSYGQEQLTYLDFAIAQAQRGSIDAIVTGPVTKEAVAAVQPDFLGHTGYLAEKLGVRDERMAFLTPEYLLALQTTHIAVRDVAKHLSVAGIATSLKMLARAGRSIWGKGMPIAVLGLNPHAGEHGLMGDEEGTIIEPAMRLCRRQGIKCDGPFPADSFFIERVHKYRLILAQYHDQGLIAVKPAFPRTSVNVTLGLPVVRTSVDHGSGYDIAGHGAASEISLLHAIKAALELVEASD